MKQATKTRAEIVSLIFGNDGQRWKTSSGLSLDEVLAAFDTARIYSKRDGAGWYVDGYPGDCCPGDPIRHLFPDGSVIVTSECGWDLEGLVPFSLDSDRMREFPPESMSGQPTGYNY